MKKLIAGLLLSAGLHAAYAADADEWMRITSNSGAVYDVKMGSVEFAKTNNGSPIVVGLFRITTSERVITFEQNYVRLYHCGVGYGLLVTTDLEGKPRYQTDFVSGGGTIASGIAKFLCDVAKVKPTSSPPTESKGLIS